MVVELSWLQLTIIWKFLACLRSLYPAYFIIDAEHYLAQISTEFKGLRRFTTPKDHLKPLRQIDWGFIDIEAIEHPTPEVGGNEVHQIFARATTALDLSTRLQPEIGDQENSLSSTRTSAATAAQQSAIEALKSSLNELESHPFSVESERCLEHLMLWNKSVSGKRDSFRWIPLKLFEDAISPCKPIV